MDVTIIEHAFGGKASLYAEICENFVGVPVNDQSMRTLTRWDDKKKLEAAKAATDEGKTTRATKKARKTQLLQRRALKAAAYTYITSDVPAEKLEAEEAGSESENVETESDTDRET